MSTRCYVGKMNSDGSIRAIYVHHDGYLDGVGAVLTEYYDNEEKIDKLLDLGDMSSLGIKPIGTWTEFPELPNYDLCQTYRERGEKNVEAKVYGNLDTYLELCDEDYTYLYKDGSWYYRRWDDKELNFVSDGE